jgi:4a-hydroxytetrahydrobiopterin dehydratase
MFKPFQQFKAIFGWFDGLNDLSPKQEERSVMEELTEQKCEACRVGAPSVTPEEMKSLKPQVPDWQVITEDAIPKLRRLFKFKNFKDAIAFTDAVGAAAEDEGHHPRLTTEWGQVAVAWWTHKIRNLHKNDFIMAAKTDAIYKKFTPPQN